MLWCAFSGASALALKLAAMKPNNDCCAVAEASS
jgi:hypothetical protein